MVLHGGAQTNQSEEEMGTRPWAKSPCFPLAAKTKGKKAMGPAAMGRGPGPGSGPAFSYPPKGKGEADPSPGPGSGPKLLLWLLRQRRRRPWAQRPGAQVQAQDWAHHFLTPPKAKAKKTQALGLGLGPSSSSSLVWARGLASGSDPGPSSFPFP